MIRSPMRGVTLLLALAGCAGSGTPMSHSDQATAAACRSHASEVYNRNNRGTIYSIGQTGLPYSGSYLPGTQTNALAEQYSNARLVDDCIRNTGPSDNTVAPDAAAP
jgi:Flp pilus assembly protein TadD